MKKFLFIFLLCFPALAFAYEDYTTYTEEDPGSTITISADTITFTNLNRNQKSFVYKDFGAGTFSADFEFRVQINMQSVNTQGWVAPVTLSNSADVIYDLLAGGGDGLWVRFFGTTAAIETIQIGEGLAGNVVNATSSELSLNTDYYLRFYRDESVGTYGTLYCSIYSDASFSTLIETISLALREKEDFRYLHGFNTYYFSTSNTSTGYVKNLIWVANISGTLKEKESDASGSAMEYLVLNRSTGAVSAFGTAAADGTYSVQVAYGSTEYDVFMLDPADVYAPKTIGEIVLGVMP